MYICSVSEIIKGRSIFNLISLFGSLIMSNKTVWIVIVILVLLGLWYWSQPAAPVTPTPVVAPTETVPLVPASPEAPAVPAAPAQ